MKNTPTAAARKLLKKLETLAERGINGERTAAQAKLERLKARYDFAMPDRGVVDLLNFEVARAPYSSVVGTIEAPDIANAVKWAFEHRFGISCRFSGTQLLAEVIPASAAHLTTAAQTICTSFTELWQSFERSAATLPQDRPLFMAGLWDGMMRQERAPGERLPTRLAAPVAKSRAKRGAVAQPARLAVHPYSIAVNLGRQIRFNANLQDIKNELENTLKGLIE